MISSKDPKRCRSASGPVPRAKEGTVPKTHIIYQTLTFSSPKSTEVLDNVTCVCRLELTLADVELSGSQHLAVTPRETSGALLYRNH
jgi:hypothetical protein